MSQDKHSFHLSLTPFIIKQCRRFGLLFNERTTVLSHSDEKQLIQYCLACFKQKKNYDFEASPAETLDVAGKIQNIEYNLIKKLLQNYKSFKERKTQTIHGEADLLKSCDEDPDVNTISSKKDSTAADVEEMKEDCEENDTLLDGVLALFTLHKKTSNQQSILDCYIRFATEVTNDQSDLHLFIKSCKDIGISANESDLLFPVQEKIFDSLRDLNPSVFLDTKRDVDQIDDYLFVSFNSQHVNTPERLKTPSRAKPSNNCTSPLCSPMQFSTPKTPAQKRQLQKTFVYDLFRCYIHLLVNSRSQLALARIFNIPDRGLDHTAFTHLKHEAVSAGLSMYQYLSSFILRIRLGGQGYAPSTGTPLMSHVKGLGCLLDFTQKLQTVVEEVTDIRSASRRVVNIIKNNLIQCKSGKFTRRLVEPCASQIQATLSAIIDAEASAVSSSPKAAGAGGTVMGRRCLQVLQDFLDQAAVHVSSETDDKMLQDLSFSSETPTRMPCLLSQFRSPCMLEVVEENEIKSKQPSKAVKQSSCFVSSALYLEEGDQPILTQKTLSTIDVLPSKTLVDSKASDSPRGKSDGAVFGLHARTANLKVPATNIEDNGSKGFRKRKAVAGGQENWSDPTESNPKISVKEKQVAGCSSTTPKSSKKTDSQCNSRPKKVGKTCRKRLLPQVKGQSKITGFFRL